MTDYVFDRLQEMDALGEHLLTQLLHNPDDTKLIRSVLSEEGQKVFDTKVTKGKDIWLPTTSGPSVKKGVVGQKQMVSAIKNAYAPKNRASGKSGGSSKYFDYFKLYDLFKTMNPEQKEAVMQNQIRTDRVKSVKEPPPPLILTPVIDQAVLQANQDRLAQALDIADAPTPPPRPDRPVLIPDKPPQIPDRPPRMPVEQPVEQPAEQSLDEMLADMDLMRGDKPPSLIGVEPREQLSPPKMTVADLGGRRGAELKHSIDRLAEEVDKGTADREEVSRGIQELEDELNQPAPDMILLPNQDPIPADSPELVKDFYGNIRQNPVNTMKDLGRTMGINSGNLIPPKSGGAPLSVAEPVVNSSPATTKPETSAVESKIEADDQLPADFKHWGGQEPVITEPGFVQKFTGAFTGQMKNGIFRAITSALATQLPIIETKYPTLNALQEAVKVWTVNALISMGFGTEVVIALIVPLVFKFVKNWFKHKKNNRPTTEVIQDETIEEPDESIEDPVAIDSPEGPKEDTDPDESKIISSEIITDTAIPQSIPNGLSVEPLVINVIPDPKIIQDTKKTEVFDPETQGNVLFAPEDNNKKDDFKVSREALFSYRRDVLGTSKTNPFVLRQQQHEDIIYNNMRIPTPNVFQPLPPNDINQFNQIWGDTPAMISQGMPSFPPLAPTVEELEKKYFGQRPTDIGGVVKPDFMTHETMMFAPNGGLNDFPQGFGNPMRDFQQTQVLDPSKEMLFGQTRAFL